MNEPDSSGEGERDLGHKKIGIGCSAPALFILAGASIWSSNSFNFWLFGVLGIIFLISSRRVAVSRWEDYLSSFSETRRAEVAAELNPARESESDAKSEDYRLAGGVVVGSLLWADLATRLTNSSLIGFVVPALVCPILLAWALRQKNASGEDDRWPEGIEGGSLVWQYRQKRKGEDYRLAGGMVVGSLLWGYFFSGMSDLPKIGYLSSLAVCPFLFTWAFMHKRRESSPVCIELNFMFFLAAFLACFAVWEILGRLGLVRE